MDNNQSGVDGVLKLLYRLLPLVLVVFGGYFGYGLYQQNKISKTYGDVLNVTKNVKAKYVGIYKNLDTREMVLNNLLDFADNIKETPNGYDVPNRFGGKTYFYEALNTKAERTLYYGLITDMNKYHQIYPGVTAFIILYTGLEQKVCKKLAQTNWKKFIPNFVGLEASYITPTAKYNGISKLKINFTVDDSENDVTYAKSNFQDKGYISSTPMTDEQSTTACACEKDNCTIALKFN